MPVKYIMEKINFNKKIVLLILCCLGWGILSAVEVEFPLIQSLSYFPYSDNGALSKNKWRLSLDLHYSNIYMYDFQRTTVNDMELLSNTLAVGFGLSDKLTLELYYRFAFAFGGSMDRLIINFHKFFGLSEGGRNDYPKNRVNYLYKDAFLYDSATTFQSPLIIGMLGNIYEKGNFRLNARLNLGLPLATKPGFSSNKSFLTLGLIFLYQGRSFSIDFANHLSFFRNPGWLADEELTPRIYNANIRINYKKIFAGFIYRSSPFKKEDLANAAYQVYVGFGFLKYFEFAFIEEFPPMDTTPDVSFNLKIKILSVR